MRGRRSASLAGLLLLGFAAAGGVLLTPSMAHAESIIKNPGDHPTYAVELDPHFVLQWDGPWDSTGFGAGFRASIPIVQNGFIPSINNSVAIGFGFDWAHFSDNCRWGTWDFDDDCEGNSFMFPVVMQWNFWLTDIISVFGEPGLAIRHTTWSADWCGDPRLGPNCRYDDDETDVVPVFIGGARFMFSESVGLSVRLGWPYLTVGASILL